MGQKINPTSFRTGFLYNWKSQWFSDRDFRDFLKQDVMIRRFIEEKLTDAGIANIQIDRSAGQITIRLETSRPGVVIGRGGKGIELLQKDIRRKIPGKVNVKLEIIEIREPEKHSALVAQSMIDQIEKRIPFRRVIRQAIDRIKQAGVKGGKVEVSGRLDGAEMSRREWLVWGSVPLQTLRADIDFTEKTAHTTYGTIGIKVWLYKGERFTTDFEEQFSKKKDSPFNK
ncbi:30S ribosomal protein S3 [Patescibacteria group bacterium]